MSRKSSPSSSFTRRDMLRVSAASLLSASVPFVSRTAWGETGVEGKTIGYSMSFSTIEWVKQQRAGVLDTAKKYNMKTIAFDANDQPAKQVRDLEDLIVRNVDIILISTYYAEAIAPAVKQINEAGIPVVVLSSSLTKDVKFDCHLSTDTLGTSRAAGEYYVKRLGGKGKFGQIEGKPGSVVNQQRGKGWHVVIDAAPGIKVVGHVVANYERAQAIKGMEDMLQSNPDLNAVYCHNDDMALGAIQATKEAGRLKNIFVTGYDGLTVEALAAIQNGSLAATWEYLPFGIEAVEVAVRLLQKKQTPKEIVFPSPLITKDNVSEWYDSAKQERKAVPSRLKV